MKIFDILRGVLGSTQAKKLLKDFTVEMVKDKIQEITQERPTDDDVQEAKKETDD